MIRLPVTVSSRQNADSQKAWGIPLLQGTNIEYSQYVSTRHCENFLTSRQSHIKRETLQICSMHRLGKIVHYKSKIIFRIAWLFQRNIGLKEAFCCNSHSQSQQNTFGDVKRDETTVVVKTRPFVVGRWYRRFYY